QNGETRQGYQVIADSVISARAARPGGNRRKTTGTQGNQPPAGTPVLNARVSPVRM
ncbi:hypothetical protein ACSLPA_33840, partial [Escherichia coli]